MMETYIPDFAVRTCTNKKRFDTRMDCEISIALHYAEVDLFAYQCPVCKGWHKTKQKPWSRM